MRAMIVVAAGVGIGLSGAASAQTAQNTPAGIVCAMTGSCDEPQGERVPVGNEKAFSLSLARPAAAAPTAAARPRVTAVAPVARPRAVGATHMAAAAAAAPRAVAPAKVQPGGGLDMLVTFKLGSAQMTPQAMAEARAFAQAMALPQMAGMRFAIEGHTDASGSREANLSLSQARAQSVMDYLVSQGIDASRLSAKGYGPDKPIRGTRATSPANRRVEFVKQG